MGNKALLHVSGDVNDMGGETRGMCTLNDEVKIVELARNFPGGAIAVRSWRLLLLSTFVSAFICKKRAQNI